MKADFVATAFVAALLDNTALVVRGAPINALYVAGPIIPSTGKPRSCWNRRTAHFVSLPYTPFYRLHCNRV